VAGGNGGSLQLGDEGGAGAVAAPGGYHCQLAEPHVVWFGVGQQHAYDLSAAVNTRTRRTGRAAALGGRYQQKFGMLKQVTRVEAAVSDMRIVLAEQRRDEAPGIV
jgi:hypothetical protein